MSAFQTSMLAALPAIEGACDVFNIKSWSHQGDAYRGVGGAFAAKGVSAMESENVKLIDEHHQLYSRVHFLATRVMASLLPDHPVYQAFERFRKFEDNCGDDETPTIKMLSDCRAAFESLPLAVRQQIMNGWNVVKSYPSPKKVHFDLNYHEGIVFRYAFVGVHGGELHAYQEWGLDECIPRPMQLLIVEGTRKEEAIAYLRRMMAFIDERWDFVVTGKLKYIDEKSGMPKNHFTPKPASTKGEEANH